MAADSQGKSETIDRLRDLFQRYGETVATLEQRVLRLEQTIAVKDDIIKTLAEDVLLSI